MTHADTIYATVTHDFDVPAERVFDAWVTPSIAARWLFGTPTGENIRTEIDARPGGRFVITDRRGDVDAEHRGEFLELERPRRIVFVYDVGDGPSRVEVDIEPAGDGCRLTVRHAMIPGWEGFVEQAKGGWSRMLERLPAALIL